MRSQLFPHATDLVNELVIFALHETLNEFLRGERAAEPSCKVEQRVSGFSRPESFLGGSWTGEALHDREWPRRLSGS
jgi:hypothetical protein